MWGHPLDVEKDDSQRVEHINGVHERSLGGIGLGVEHRFSGEHSSDIYAIHATHEFALIVEATEPPGFSEGVAEIELLQIEGNEMRGLRKDDLKELAGLFDALIR